ncbi:unnamed protein product [Microthlaspi erraticum]|uniref:F-box domain-containing protein n=1 Tax=Microthlaspi erraticum TaxID=1685480 RepID=A0A6D2HUA8_9BRAS|nr:unnamed protein product [Microthlaspi erraticum]
MSSKARSSSATNGEDPPRKKPSPATKPTSISIWSLPHVLLLDCLARISRLYYPTLSLVSKSFRSIIASPELYETRKRLNRTEKCLYICIRFPFDTETHWSTLCRLPTRKIANESSGYFTELIPSPKYLRPSQSSTLVAVGSDIYKIGGADDLYQCKIWKRNYSSSVSICP